MHYKLLFSLLLFLCSVLMVNAQTDTDEADTGVASSDSAVIVGGADLNVADDISNVLPSESSLQKGDILEQKNNQDNFISKNDRLSGNISANSSVILIITLLCIQIIITTVFFVILNSKNRS